MASLRKRADILLVERGLFESRARARAAIEAGNVTANDAKVAKPSDIIPADAVLQAERFACHHLLLGNLRLCHRLIAAERNEAVQFRLQTFGTPHDGPGDLDGRHLFPDDARAQIGSRQKAKILRQRSPSAIVDRALNAMGIVL